MSLPHLLLQGPSPGLTMKQTHNFMNLIPTQREDYYHSHFLGKEFGRSERLGDLPKGPQPISYTFNPISFDPLVTTGEQYWILT